LKGGSNLANEQSVFRFDLNDSLYFEKGQEVAEIMGISLDPEISIQEFADYISIRGVVELQGSYQKLVQVEEEEEDDSYFETYDSRRYMERVTDTSYGGAEFMHRFPVEITVPSYRVENLNDVLVTIAEFDYELPEPDHLYLRSTIEIHGINNQIEEVEEDEEDSESFVKELEEESISVRGSDDTFEFEVKTEIESSSYEASPELKEVIPVEQDEEMESDRWKFMKETKTFEEFFKKKETEIEVEEALLEESSSNEDESESSSKSESHESREGNADLTYLSDMFRNSEEEYIKLKLCIVQDRDTLETLAEKYETSTVQIRSYNRLEADDVTEGQLLYIPLKK
jgi:stage VI sporulation protein D